MPQGDHVRHGPHWLPDCIRWPVCGWGSGNDDPAAELPGYTAFDLYPAGPDHKGDLEAAKKSLEACGQPNGFETNIAYRAERPKEKATAEAFQQALGRVGIKLTLKPYPQGDYFAQYAGLPPYVVKNKLGLAVNGWGADWPLGRMPGRKRLSA